MAQWTNIQRMSKFVNPTQSYISCENFGILHLVETDLAAGRLAGWLADKIQRKFKIFLKLAVDQSIFRFV